MDLKKLGGWLQKALKRENTLRLVVVLGICGIALLALSSWEPSQPEPEPPSGEDADAAYAQALEQDLCRIVSAITGERDPAVMVTLENTGRRVYAADGREESQSGPEGGGSLEKENSHVILEDSQGAQRALTVTQVQPKVQGVVIVSAKAGDAATREKLVNAAKTALGVPASRVCVTGG